MIKHWEGLTEIPSLDEGRAMWGYGHDAQPGESAPESITADEADALLRHDLATRFEPALNRALKVECTQNQYDALVDWAYNVGCEAMVHSTLIALVNDARDYDAAEQFMAWDHAGGEVSAGLIGRRKAERALFLGEEA